MLHPSLKDQCTQISRRRKLQLAIDADCEGSAPANHGAAAMAYKAIDHGQCR
jgi:hypothetical protein